jgi:hypothetical protein
MSNLIIKHNFIVEDEKKQLWEGITFLNKKEFLRAYGIKFKMLISWKENHQKLWIKY